MKIQFLESDKQNKVIKIFYHPKQKRDITYIKKALQACHDTIPVYDEYHNVEMIHSNDIYYIEVIDKKVFVYTKENVYRVYGSFTTCKEKIKVPYFIAINATTIVNIHHIASFHTIADCKRLVKLDNNETLIVSRKFKNIFDKIMKE